MGFDGLVIPDDLTMFAISKNFGIPQAAAMCLAAGSDMIFMKVPEQYAPSVTMTKQFLREGKLTEERINQSLLRILRLKFKRGLFEKRRFSARNVLSTIGCKEHAAVARCAARNSVAVLKNRSSTLPLRMKNKKSILVIVPRDMNIVLSNDESLSHDMLPRALQKHYADVQHVVVDEAPTQYQAYEASGRAKNADVIVFGIYSGGVSEAYLETMKSIMALQKTSIAVITNSPFMSTLLPSGIDSVICSFGLTPFAFEAVADVIAGKAKATANLPMKLNNNKK
jgi:beta-N-acetylhexosaminidase